MSCYTHGVTAEMCNLLFPVTERAERQKTPDPRWGFSIFIRIIEREEHYYAESSLCSWKRFD